MPRSSVVVSAEPVGAAAIARAVGAVQAAGAVRSTARQDAVGFELRPVDGGAVLQVLAEGRVVLSVLRPRLLPTPDEVARLLPGVDVGADVSWWSDAYTPWSPEGAIGVAVLDALGAASGAQVVHQGLAPARPLPPGRASSGIS